MLFKRFRWGRAPEASGSSLGTRPLAATMPLANGFQTNWIPLSCACEAGWREVGCSSRNSMISGMPWVGARSAPATCRAVQIVWNPQGLQAKWQRSFPARLKALPKLSRAAPRSRHAAIRLESACFTSESTRGGTVVVLDILSVSVRML